MKKFFFIFLLLSLFRANATVSTVHKDEINANQVSAVGVYFNGTVNNQTMTWLLSALYEINNNFNNVKYVDLYINSPGGDIDAAYFAYEAIKKYPIKLNAINSSMTSSAATLLYCASADRYTMPLSIFVLHPPAVKSDGNDYVQPDKITRALQEAEFYSYKFKSIYSKCTNINDRDMHNLLYSDSERMVLDASHAEIKGLVTKGIKQSETYAVTYFITDK